jgi:hypothetical protein
MNVAFWVDHHPLAQPDPGVVEERAALVDEHPLGQVQVQPVVGVERRVDRHPRPASATGRSPRSAPARPASPGRQQQTTILSSRTSSAAARLTSPHTAPRTPSGQRVRRRGDHSLAVRHRAGRSAATERSRAPNQSSARGDRIGMHRGGSCKRPDLPRVAHHRLRCVQVGRTVDAPVLSGEDAVGQSSMSCWPGTPGLMG